MSQDGNNEEEKYVHSEGGIPIFGPTPRDKDAEKRAEQKAARSYEDRQISIQRQILLTQIGLVVFGLIGAGIGLWQASISRSAADAATVAANASKSAADTASQTLNEMRTGSGAQDTHTLAQQAVTQATQTTNLATETKTISAQAMDNFQMGQRAWVLIDTLQFRSPLIANNFAFIDMTTANVGQSPALKKSQTGGVSTTGEVCHLVSVPVDKVSSHTMGLGQKSAVALMTVRLDSRCVDALNHELAQLFVKGTITYTDVFKRPHFTNYCAEYDSLSHQLVICKDGNDLN